MSMQASEKASWKISHTLLVFPLEDAEYCQVSSHCRYFLWESANLLNKLLEHSIFLSYDIEEPNYIIDLWVQCSRKDPALYSETDYWEAGVKYIINFEDG